MTSPVFPELRAQQVQYRRSRTKAAADAFVGAEGEVTIDLQMRLVHIHIGDGKLGGYVVGADFLNSLLTGFTVGPNSPVLATDTVLQAFQKLQAQINDLQAHAPPLLTLTGVGITGVGAVIDFDGDPRPTDYAHRLHIRTGTGALSSSGTMWRCRFATQFAQRCHPVIIPTKGSQARLPGRAELMPSNNFVYLKLEYLVNWNGDLPLPPNTDLYFQVRNFP